MNDVATWTVTAITTVTAVLGVVFSWPAFADWRRSRSENDRTASAEGTSLDRIRLHGQLRVGCIPFPPLIHCPKGPDSTAGLYRDIFDDIGARNNWDIVYVPVRNDTAMDRLIDNEVDIIACLLETPERAARATFTARIHQMAICGVVRRDSMTISSQSDLRAEHVKAIVVEGEIGAEVARRHFGMTPDNGRLHEIVTTDVSAIFGPVMSRHADVAITDGVTCADFLESNPEAAEMLVLRFTADPLWLVPCGLMLRQGDDELATLLDSEVRESVKRVSVATKNDALAERYRDLLRPM